MPRILDNPKFRGELAAIAKATGRTLEEVSSEARDNLEEMRGDRKGLAVSAFAWLSRYVCRRGYDPDYYHDTKELEWVRSLAAKKSVVYLVTHKTYLDFFVLYDFFYRNGIAPPYVFGGINMAFSGFGFFARRAGGIFIRRTFADNPVYKAVLRRYIQHLIAEGCSFSWAIEGTRSRTGKLVQPKLGLLKYVADAARPLGDDAVAYIPVSVSYDQIPDVADMSAQEAGATKEPESLSWFVSYIRRLGNRFGNIYIRFGDAIAIGDTPDAPDLTASQRLVAPEIIGVRKLAFEVCYHINEVTPATVTSLILMSLLCRTAAKPERIGADVSALHNYLAKRQSSSIFASPNRLIDGDFDAALSTLIANGIVRQDRDADYCSIVPERYLVALYYSNMAVHHFVIAAFTELGLLNVAHARSGTGEPAFRAEVQRLRDLFKFEFFFSRADSFREQFIEELNYLDAPLDAIGAGDRGAAESLLRRQPLLVAYGALSPFINAYQVVANCLLRDGADSVNDHNAFIASCQAESRKTGAGYPGFASKALLTNGLSLAENRGLLGSGDNVAERRQDFANELHFIAGQLHEIRGMTA
ncbi:MAG: 1-acyl-sn-glycerol-3-phosphate acyltransferase [Gammaproteobacteria bacterium]|nr:1-acyl-sn-glycerol-3-phosphate acyltransferase [Gammaproteobacteria bacterium]MDH3372155.1 1-acyl-sn-glycerol-3-phosphate acyltransferase [Gammaproteobacteria bacterium]MDH3410331.1 1-acyl-sn-glycerol-3-phosphate acyltransferase [Gammaproteobacteria bacterium]MDH3552704.1 1-acyl-sn-glycerol-3-phosphate acyltransferase [Gammaproteobacteria bacterium]